jgi:hypothetical protein
MSGEIVAAPIGLVALPIIAVGAIVYGAGSIIKKIVDNQIEAAERAREIEKARIQEWRDYQENEHRQMQVNQQQYEVMQDIDRRLRAISLIIPIENISAGVPTAQGYHTLKSKVDAVSVEELQKFLHKISTLLDSTPSEFRDAPDSPFGRLKQQEKLLIEKSGTSRKLLKEEIESFHSAICLTIAGNLKRFEQYQTRAKEAKHCLQTLLDDVLTSMHITEDPAIQISLQNVKTQVISLMNKQPVSLARMELLQKKVSLIKSDAVNWLTNGAFRSTLAQSLVRNLEEMGYKSSEPFPENPHSNMMRAEMAIPEGERLKITIDRLNRMSFRVYHESHSENEPLTFEDKLHFRHQEKKWCEDMSDLMHRLTLEGFAYSIEAERLIPDLSIPVVVVENTDSILSQKNKKEVEKRRRRIQQKNNKRRTL